MRKKSVPAARRNRDARYFEKHDFAEYRKPSGSASGFAARDLPHLKPYPEIPLEPQLVVACCTTTCWGRSGFPDSL